MKEYLGKPNPASDLIPMVQFLTELALLDTEGERKAKRSTISSDEAFFVLNDLILEARRVLKDKYPRFYPDDEDEVEESIVTVAFEDLPELHNG